MADKDLNTVAEFESVMTPQEIQALKDAEEGFDFGDSDEFDEVEVKLAKETIEERTRREAEGVDYGHDEAAAKAEEDKAEGREPEAEEPAAAEAEPEAQAEDEAPEAKAEDEATPKQPEFDAEAYAKAIEAVDRDIEAKISALTDKYDEAEITTAEFKQQIADLNAGRREAITEQISRASFDNALRAFFAENAGLNSEDHIEGLDAAFTAVDKSPAFKGASDREKLEEAHRVYYEQTARAREKGWTNLEVPAPKAIAPKVEAKTEDPKAEAKPAPKADGKLTYKPRPEGEAPKTLAKMPASDASQQGGTKADTIMALLNSKDPDAIEKALRSNAISLADLEEIG